MHNSLSDCPNLGEPKINGGVKIKSRRLNNLQDLALLLPDKIRQYSPDQGDLNNSGMKSEPKTPLMVPPKRTCGHCDLCCIHLQIDSEQGFSTLLHSNEDIAKKAGTPCKFLGPKGCRVYDKRPRVCREFACDWLKGNTLPQEKDSPLQTGIIGVGGVNLVLKPSN